VSTTALPSSAPGTPRSAGGLRDAGGGRYVLEGAVTLAPDLSGVGRADSGALALLVDWLAWARAAHRVLKFSAPPAALMALARLSDVEDLLLGKEP